MILINIFKFRPQKICVNHIYFEDLHKMIKTLHSYDHKDEIHIYYYAPDKAEFSAYGQKFAMSNVYI